MTTEDNSAKDQAKAQLESIKEMVAALHVDYDNLGNLREGFAAYCSDPQGKRFPTEISEELHILEQQAGDIAELDDAIQRIQEDPLSVQVRTGWYSPHGGELTPGPEEFEILLCTGGPAVRIIGDLYADGAPANPYIQYQDWGTPWTDYPLDSDERATVIEYCQQFYFGG